MKKTIQIFLIVISFSYGSDNQFLKNIAEKFRDYNILIVIPSEINNTEKTEVCVNSSELFEHIYQKAFSEKYTDYYSFLLDLLRDKVQLDSNQIKIIRKYNVNENSILFEEYEHKGFSYIKEMYLQQKEDKLITSEKLKWSDRGSLIKIMFDEEYYPIDDDYSGELWFFKNFKIESK